MVLCIVGSVSLEGNEEAANVVRAVLTALKPSKVISGGARGIDRLAATVARNMGIPVNDEDYTPTRKRWEGPGGFKERNVRLARDCDQLVRIVASGSKTYGSGWTRDLAASMGKPTAEYVVQLS